LYGRIASTSEPPAGLDARTSISNTGQPSITPTRAECVSAKSPCRQVVAIESR
jgi:hypothetical protein